MAEGAAEIEQIESGDNSNGRLRLIPEDTHRARNRNPGRKTSKIACEWVRPNRKRVSQEWPLNKEWRFQVASSKYVTLCMMAWSAEGVLRLELGLPNDAKSGSLAAWQPRPCQRVIVAAARRQVRLVVTREILDEFEYL